MTENIGDRILKFRSLKGLGREELCKNNPKLKVATLRRYEENKNENHSIEFLIELAKELDIPVELLYKSDADAFEFDKEAFYHKLERCKGLRLNEQVLLDELIERILNLNDIESITASLKERKNMRVYSLNHK